MLLKVRTRQFNPNFTVLTVIYWDFASLYLPLPAVAGPPVGVEFIFTDFITALKRVKNDVYAAFVQPEIRTVSPWIPTDWSEESGLQVQISFTDGLKPSKIDAVLAAVVAQMEVVIERECEYRDYLICDTFSLTVSHSPISESRKRALVEEVVFRVSGSGLTLIPSFLTACVLLVMLI